jgi:SAM-dependent methyltransferase
MTQDPGMAALSVAQVQSCLAEHLPIYRRRAPVYQTLMLNSLRQQWDPRHRTLLDVGGGTGVMAQAMQKFFGLERVVSVDVENRFLPTLTVESRTFDGQQLPFADATFDCVVLFNVLHHVPLAARAALMRECHRVAGRGPIYIKDHLSQGTLDDARLAILDLLGNLPFHGMLRARYLREADWQALALAGGYERGPPLSARYRGGVFGALFPNRLEVSMKWSAVRP